MLVWYIKRQCTEGQEEFLIKADYLFDYFERNKILVVIPSLAVAELLGSVDDEDERDEYFDYMTNNFEIAQYDIVSAKIYSELRVNLTKTNAKSYSSEKNIPKCMMTNDYNICSIALSSGCDAIFSHNLKDFEKFANHRIPIYTLDHVDILKAQDKENNKNGDTSQLGFFEDLDDIPS